MKEIYLDNSATTALSPAAKRAMTEAMELYGNPSSLHEAGNRAKELLENARIAVARTLGVRRPQAGELLFTSCGSESDNLAVLGTAYVDLTAFEIRIIESVHRLTEFIKYIVCDINYVRDSRTANKSQTALHPRR